MVVDFGAQYAQLIARRVRECEVYSEIVPASISAAEIRARAPVGLILSGGPASVHVEDAPSLDPGIYDLGLPILGICYGAQLIAEQLGGRVGPNDRGEYGRAELRLVGSDDEREVGLGGPPGGGSHGRAGAGETAVTVIDDRTDGPSVLLSGLPSPQPVWMSHFDAIVEPPIGATVTAFTPASPVAAFEDVQRRRFGVQFHPEVQHTPHGKAVIERFLRRACNAGASWSMTSIIESAVAAAREQIGERTAICGLSGGVDSAVAAALVHRAIGDRLTCVLVDTGLLRLGEADQVEQAFAEHFGIELLRVDAAAEFFAALGRGD